MGCRLGRAQDGSPERAGAVEAEAAGSMRRHGGGVASGGLTEGDTRVSYEHWASQHEGEEPLMLKRQVELDFFDRSEAIRIWQTIPERCRRQVVEGYARAIGDAAKDHARARTEQEEREDVYTSES